MHINLKYSLLAIASLTTSILQAHKNFTLENSLLRLEWMTTPQGYLLNRVKVGHIPCAVSRYQHAVVFANTKPSTDPLLSSLYTDMESFPEPQYRYIIPTWKESTTEVSFNKAGKEYCALPQHLKKLGKNAICMKYENEFCKITEIWSLDEKHSTDIRVKQTMTAKKDGYYSLSTPSIVSTPEQDLQYAIIPGVIHGNKLNQDFIHSYAYSFGIPNRPVIVRERSTSTLTSMITNNDGITCAVTAEPGTGRDPWMYDKRTDKVWKLGLALMNRHSELTPTLYHPVIGESESYVHKGEKRTFCFRYTLNKDTWFNTYKHIVNDIYEFPGSLILRHNTHSLTERLYMIYDYLVNDSTSKWRNCEYDGYIIGAQDYLGGVFQSKKDAMKNADYGAMWMLAKETGDERLLKKRLPFALNFKFVQQEKKDSFFKGAPKGQYYLYKGKQFTEEWGPYTEPIGTTYYMLMDLGNIWLFENNKSNLEKEIRMAADRLLSWMGKNGEWQVAYSNSSHEPVFTDVKDFRPTFYGLVVAYRILCDTKYLDAACRGADWFIDNAVKPSSYLGVCGDTRFVGDFATVQSAQALLDLYEITGNDKYKDAAIDVAKFYTTSVYTHPIASSEKKIVKGKEYQDWQISQSGLSFEHGGVLGSANLHGPILLASHAGLFIRIARLTGEKLFLDMARAAAIGRDAFVDPKTGVASYYWSSMNQGAGPYPHHAWWQVGWITDYLISEAEYRSNGDISFPAGFIAPKVGAHRAYGYSDGTVMGEKASLVMCHGLVTTDNPNVEYLIAKGNNKFFVIFLNDLSEEQTVKININSQCLNPEKGKESLKISLRPYGIRTITFTK